MKVEILTQKGYKFLWIDDYLWMWDIPIEQEIQKKIANEAYGKVLVAGYGLGIVQRYISQNENVTQLLTIEKEPEVILACRKEYQDIFGNIIYSDFYEYDNITFFEYNDITKFDCVIGDIWEEIDSANLEEYKKFKIKAESLLKPGGKILAWGKDYFEYLIKQEFLTSGYDVDLGNF